MQQLEWVLVPNPLTNEMTSAMADALEDPENERSSWDLAENMFVAMLAAAPEPPHLSMTKEEAATFQDWKGMDGACAFHLIERHANGWGDTARMMEAWLAANVAPSNAGGKPLEKSD